MAKQVSVMKFTGKLGNIIGYRRNGEYFYRSTPEKVQQTAVTKRAAHNFGVASRKGRLIRSAFSAELDVTCDGSAGNRLNGALIKAGRNNTAAIKGFQFNKHAATDRFFPVTPVFCADGRLHIPAQQLRRMKGISHLEIKLIAARIDFAMRLISGTDADAVMIDLQQSFDGADLSVNVPGKGLLVVTLQVRGFLGSSPSGNKQFMAADVIAVVEPGTEQKQVHSFERVKEMMQRWPGRVSMESMEQYLAMDQRE